MLTNTGLTKTISDCKNFIKSHETIYKKFVERFNYQLDIIKSEIEKYPNFDKDKVEDVRCEIDKILSDFNESYIRPLDSDPGTTPFDCIRGLLPLIDQYL